MAFESILNPVFGPLLRLAPVVSLAILSTVLSLLITLIYKWMTDQQQMKSMKEEIKKSQKQIKESRNDPKKAMALQKKALEINMKYMMQSMKPTLVTFIPIILIFAWLNANMAYEPIRPNTVFSTTATFDKLADGAATLNVPAGLTLVSNASQIIVNHLATWQLKGAAGDYFLEYEYKSEKKQRPVIVSEGISYAKVEDRYSKSLFTKIKTNNQAVHPFGSLSIFGWMPGWLATYILFSLLSSLGLRKLLKVY